MSIATLKRKTQAKYNNISVGQDGFSLNGTHRSQGYVGQTSISRSLPRTPMNGPVARGYGGNYSMGRIVQSAVTSLNDPTVVKQSVINTRGMLDEKLQCMSNIQQTYFISTGKYSVVKPDNNRHLNNQSDYITNKTKNAIKNANLACNIHHDLSLNPCHKACSNKDPFLFNGATYINHTKPARDYVPISQSEHIVNKSNICINQDVVTVKSNNKNTPFGCG
jgi:hypothetical protein